MKYHVDDFINSVDYDVAMRNCPTVGTKEVAVTIPVVLIEGLPLKPVAVHYIYQ